MPEHARSVYLQTIDYPNFKRTVETPIQPNDYEAPLSELADTNTGDGVRCWGVRAGEQNQTYYDSMNPGDLVLCYHSKRYVGVGYIDSKFLDVEGWVAEHFWDDAPAKNIYTLTDFTPLDIPHSAVHTIFGYSANWYPQGLMRVKDGRVSTSVQAIKLAVERYHDRHH